ncbi:MAG: elongation factor P [Acidobacteriota bacterium]
MIQATQIRAGMVIIKDGQLYRVVNVNHHTPGNKRGMVQTNLRNLKTGANHDHRFRSTDWVEQGLLEQQEMEYLYSSGEEYVFMNTETFEQIHLGAEILGASVHYLTPNSRIRIEFHEGAPISVSLPLTVNLKVVETEPALKGATVTNQLKPAKLETGLVVQVPPFIGIGEVIRIDTADGKYIERAK